MLLTVVGITSTYAKSLPGRLSVALFLLPRTSRAFSSMPSPPYVYRSAAVPASIDFSQLTQDLAASHDKRQAAYDTSRKIQCALVQARQEIENGQTLDIADTAKELINSVAPPDSGSQRTVREANLNSRVEDYVQLEAYSHFLKNGLLLPPSKVTYATDEEYLAGACMGLCQDLARYGVGRATARDVESVEQARNLVQFMLEYLMGFNFRNGYLRRRYDGTKYSLKRLEALLYELSITGAEVQEQGDAKRRRIDPNFPLDELDPLRERISLRDEQREKLIKLCRDGQKAAKQSIFALHRGDVQKAWKLLQDCERCIKQDLLPIVNDEPPLRSGSFAGVMEEYAEAKLFFTWLMGRGDGTEANGSLPGTPDGSLLSLQDFDIHLQPEEYVGGLCDLTGEIGRFAVQRGTARDVSGVLQCLDGTNAILRAIQTLEHPPGGTGKKMDQLNRSIEKLERMLYEMSLSEAAGGRKIDAENVPVESGEPS